MRPAVREGSVDCISLSAIKVLRFSQSSTGCCSSPQELWSGLSVQEKAGAVVLASAIPGETLTEFTVSYWECCSFFWETAGLSF